MADTKIPLSEALEITTQEIKEYVDDRPAVSYEKSQNLSARNRTVAKNNIGVYICPEEPAGAVNGDVWFDTDDVTPTVPSAPSVLIDKTLMQDGQAADAKAVGEAIAEINNRIEHAPSIVAKINTDNVLQVYFG